MFHNSALEGLIGPKLFHLIIFSTLSGNIFGLEKKVNYLWKGPKQGPLSLPSICFLESEINSQDTSFQHFESQMKSLILRI